MSQKYPWDSWVPGALSFNQISVLINEGYIDRKENSEAELDHSSIDLTLSDEAYEFASGSVKPFGGRYLNRIKRMDLIKKLPPNSENIFQLNKKTTYLIRLNENIASLRDTQIYGQATAKSTIGRMDVLARLVVDGMETYEEFRPESIGNGSMYLEITPITFNVRVKAGTSLTQLRFFKGSPSECEISSPAFFGTVIQNDPDNIDGSLSLDTSLVRINKSSLLKASAFKSKQGDMNDAPIDLWGKEHTPPEEYWEPVKCDKYKRIKIEPGSFYIMRSHEKIAVPKGVAVYCRAIDETIGEMRIHYAGFAHPFFGYKASDEPVGTPLVFEVRGHDVPVSLGHREKMAKLVFYRMSEDANLEKKGISDLDPYQHQKLQLSKIFKGWSDERSL